MHPNSRQRFVLYGKTFIIPALFILLATGLINWFYGVSGSRSDRNMKSLRTYTARLETMAERVDAVRAVKRLRLNVMFQPVVTLAQDGKRAKGRWRLFYVPEAGEHKAEKEAGIYENEYVLENGIWKIESMRSYYEFSDSHEHNGLMKKGNIPVHYTSDMAGSPVTEKNRLPEAAGTAPARRNLDLRLKNLLMRASVITDENEVKNLQNRYGYYVDRKMWNDASGLFARDAVLHTGNGKVYSGRRNISRALEEAEKGNGLNYIQEQLILDLSVRDTAAEAKGIKFILSAEHGEIREQIFRKFNNEYIKQGGVWLIRSMREIYQPFENGDIVAIEAAETSAKFKSISKAESEQRDFTIYDLNKMAEEIEQSLRRAMAYESCENIVNAYGYYIDESMRKELSELFTQKGWNDFSLKDVLKTFSSGYMIQPVINVSKDGKKADIQVRLFDADFKDNRFYGNALLKIKALIEDGVWKIDGLDMEI